MKLAALFRSFKASCSSGDAAGADTSGDGGGSAPLQPSVAATPTLTTTKRFAGFLSHFKHECGTEARLVQQNMKPIIEKNPIEGCSNDVFLDSDDLSDLRNLLNHVRESQVLVLL